MKHGTILPLLNIQDELSILEAMDNGLTIDIYVDTDGYAEGLLYWDDGVSLESQKALVHLILENNILWVTKLYQLHSTGNVKVKVMTNVNIYFDSLNELFKKSSI